MSFEINNSKQGMFFVFIPSGLYTTAPTLKYASEEHCKLKISVTVDKESPCQYIAGIWNADKKSLTITKMTKQAISWLKRHDLVAFVNGVDITGMLPLFQQKVQDAPGITVSATPV